MDYRNKVGCQVRWGHGLLLSLGFSLVVWVSGVSAYQEAPVTDGGRIAGKVTIKGGKPVPRGFNLVTFPDPLYCGRISNGTGWRVTGSSALMSCRTPMISSSWLRNGTVRKETEW